MNEIKLINGKFYQTKELTNEEILDKLNGIEIKQETKTELIPLIPTNKKKLPKGCYEKIGEYYWTWDCAMKESKKQGLRIPTIEEWDEIAKGKTYEDLGLKLSGYRDTSGTFNSQGSIGYYWSATEGNATNSRFQYFDTTAGSRSSSSKGYGFSVRCIKD